MSRKPRLLLISVAVVSLLAGLFVYSPILGDKAPWRLGLDLVGGTQLVYDIDLSAVEPGDQSAVVDGLRDVMERRSNLFGVSEPQVVTAKSNDGYRLIVELAGIRDPKTAIAQIGVTASLEFKEVDQVGEGESATFNYKSTGLTGRYLTKAQVVNDPNTQQFQILINFNSEGARLFEEITGRSIQKPLAIFLDNQLISAPTVQEKITGGEAVISGRFTFEAARDLANLLNAGALPAPVKLASQQTVGASLGLDSLKKTVFAGFIGTLVVMLFMIIYYRIFGVFSVLALLSYILLSLAIFKGISMTMTLASIAGFILSIGMAVDANVLIFERTKEEMKKGLSRSVAIEEGFRRAWLSIRDSNVSTIITSLILYYFTTSFVKGFALALLIGVLVSMFSAITITRTLLRVFLKSNISHRTPNA